MAIVKDFHGRERIPSASAKPAAATPRAPSGGNAAPSYTPPASGWTSSDQRAEQNAIRNLQKSGGSAPAYTAQPAGNPAAGYAAPSANGTAAREGGWDGNSFFTRLDERFRELQNRLAKKQDTLNAQKAQAAATTGNRNVTMQKRAEEIQTVLQANLPHLRDIAEKQRARTEREKKELAERLSDAQKNLIPLLSRLPKDFPTRD